MRRPVALLLVVAVAGLAYGRVRDDEVRKAMRAAHYGDDSPFHRLVGVKEEKLNEDLSWEQMREIAASLSKANDAIRKSKLPKGGDFSEQGGVGLYRDGVDGLFAAAKAEDRDMARKAAGSLMTSCSYCHHYYHPGFGRKE